MVKPIDRDAESNGRGGRHADARDCTADGGLPPKEEAAALALAAGDTQAEAARKSRAGLRTVKSWLATRPEFVGRVRELRREMTDRALGRLTDATCAAADTLRGLLKSRNESIQLGAAKAILETATRLREFVELEERIAALEAARSVAGPSAAANGRNGR